MRKSEKSPFYSAAHTATNSAPTVVTDGVACVYSAVGADEYNADEWTVVAKFASGCTTCTIVPYTWVGPDTGGAWVAGASYNLKLTADIDGGAQLDLPAKGCDRRLFFLVSAVDNVAGFTLEAWQNEHHEGL